MSEGPRNEELEINLFGLLKTIWQRKVFLAGGLILGFAFGWAWFSLADKVYSSSITFVQSKGEMDLSAMQGLGALSMLGMGQGSSEPPLLKHLEKYIKTRDFLLALKDSVYRDTLLLKKILGKNAEMPNAPQAFAGRMASLLKVSRENGMITIKVQYPDPDFCYYLVNTVYARFAGDFTQERRNLLKDNLVFVRDLVEKSREESQRAASDMRMFMERNREMGAPIIEQKRHEIMLRVKMAEEKYIQAEKEKALLEIKNERKDESLVMIERAFVPDSPTYPKLPMCLAISMGIMLVLGCLTVGIVDRKRWISLLR